MITAWETLADALRNELQEYGELLNLFDKQQAAILKRDPDTVLVLNDSITAPPEVCPTSCFCAAARTR